MCVYHICSFQIIILKVILNVVVCVYYVINRMPCVCVYVALLMGNGVLCLRACAFYTDMYAV